MKKPSVTELTRLLDKPALMNWANKKGLEGFKLSDIRKKNTSKGNSLHNQIEEYINTSGKYQLEDETLKINLDYFLNSIEVLDVEKVIETEYFTGRLDIRYKKDGKTFIGDFKTNQSGVYLENKLQLVGYSMGVECDSFSIISIPKMIIKNVEIKNRHPYETILKNLCMIYVNKKNIENE